MFNFKGKTAVITGASRGIGKAAALKLAEYGADIAVIFAGSLDAAQDTVKSAEGFGVRALPYRCDVSDFEAAGETCKRIVADFGGADILVNNAGITKDGLLIKMPEDDFDRVVNVNLKGVFNFTRHLSRYLIKSPEGRIINISSVSGISGNAGQANYSAAKAGIIGLSKTAAKELAGRGVTVNVIAPGFIETDMTDALPQSAADSVKALVPLKRMGTPEDVASLVLFLASGAAAYITGEVIKIDGGMCI